MLSGNGRHRRPRQAPALVVAAGVTGSAIAIPLLGATSAGAADTAITADAPNWDRLAECESGGVWSADMGNGYYGGLQFTQLLWEEFGGLDYAPSAHLASRSQQIAVAEKVFADRGPDAWPTCAPIAGLGELVNPTPEDPTPSDPADAEPTDIPPEPDNTGDAGDADDGGDTADTGNESGSDNTGNSGQPEPSSPPEPEPEESADPEPPAPDPSEGTGGHRGEPAPDEASRAGDSRGDGDYTVRPGDSLSLIADNRDVDGGWPALYEANEGVVGENPDLIVPGLSLDLDLDAK